MKASTIDQMLFSDCSTFSTTGYIRTYCNRSSKSFISNILILFYSIFSAQLRIILFGACSHFVIKFSTLFVAKLIIFHRYLSRIRRRIYIAADHTAYRTGNQFAVCQNLFAFFSCQSVRIFAVCQSLPDYLAHSRTDRTILTLTLIRRRCRTARYGMGNLVDYVVLIQLFDFTGCFSMRGIDQSRKDIRFQIVFQAAAVDSGINQCGTARIG
ncbi:Uncharacterised protein [Neisseria meningitidis]|nr:Uncharacterised protein [Neisseria meningitidis]